jgi:hypothetical protein
VEAKLNPWRDRYYAIIAAEKGRGRRPTLAAVKGKILTFKPICTFALAAALALVLADCSSSLLSHGVPMASLPGAPKQAQEQRAPVPSSREHGRILAPYNGTYEDPEREGPFNKIAARLLPSSEQPNVHDHRPWRASACCGCDHHPLDRTIA